MGDYKDALQVSPKVFCWVGIDRDQDLSLRVSERYLWALLVMHIIISLASNMTNELVAG